MLFRNKILVIKAYGILSSLASLLWCDKKFYTFDDNYPLRIELPEVWKI
jgi:hypothetical protein